MSKTAVLFAEGFEEGEALTIVDIIRRANLDCDIVGVGKEIIRGAHDIVVKSDCILDENINDYDMVVLPGGIPGAINLRDDEKVIKLIQKMNSENKFVAAMCAAPIALERAGVLENKKYTAYPGYDKKINTTGEYLEDKVVIDGNIITSRGPATVYAFAYKLVDILGGDSLAVKKRMVYFNSFNVKEEE